MERSLRFEIPALPPAELSPNSRCHWARRHHANHSWKVEVYWAVRGALGREGLPSTVMFANANAAITFVVPDKRKRDPDNFIARMKPTWDVLQDCKVLEGDDWQHFTIQPPKFEVGKEAKTIVEIQNRRRKQ